MSDLGALPTWNDDDLLHVVVETPADCRVKYAYAPELGHFVISRPLAMGIHYPYDWGFIPNTRCDDGDPFDAMVLAAFPTYPGVVHVCRPLGIVQVTQKGKDGKRERNDRVIAAPQYDSVLKEDIDDELDANCRKQLEQFFLNAALFEKKKIHIEGWEGPKAARKAIKAHEIGQRK